MKLGNFFVASLLLGGCGNVNQFADAAIPVCDDSNPCTVDTVGEDGACEFNAGNAGAVCREAAGDCDVAEECSGDSMDCPDDELLAEGEVCRASGGECDPAEACTGSDAACPADASGHRLVGAKGSTFAGDLLVLDRADGSTIRTIGPIGFSVSGLAQHPTTGVLYGTTGSNSPVNPSSLITVDPATGAGTLVGAGGRNADLEFASDGTLYAWNETGDALAVVDTATGVATNFTSVVSSRGSGLAFDAAGNLYFAGSDNTGPLRTMDRTNGAVLTDTVVMSGSLIPDANPISSLAFDPDSGVLYGVNINIGGGKRRGNGDGTGGGRGDGTGGGKGVGLGKEAHLIRIDPATGAITDLGRTVDNLDAIEFLACE